MKSQHTTDRRDSFTDWRISKINLFGPFLWPQINYDFKNANVISVVFEQNGELNSNIPLQRLESTGITNFLVNFIDPRSSNYVIPSELAKSLKLRLANPLPADWKGKTYWQYRLATRPQNCLTSDIDALEIKADGSFVAIEAAQLYDTSNIDVAIRHIFRSFKFRPNQVNPKQYFAQHKYAKKINGESYILFHQITQGQIDSTKPAFTIKNDGLFFEMLTNIITKYSKSDEDLFVKDYYNYLNNALIWHANIEAAYRWLLS